MVYTIKDKEQIERIQKGLKCSYDEACEVYESDKEIDKGIAQDFDLSKEKEKIAKSFAHTTSVEKKEKTAPTVYKFDTRERKADTTKEGVIEQIYNFLCENGYENVEILNKSKLIAFKIGEDSYEFDLKRKRKPKNS